MIKKITAWLFFAIAVLGLVLTVIVYFIAWLDEKERRMLDLYWDD